MKQYNESGRSMVEMLGVLAVMGLISITGLMGYTYAMKRHQVNELINEANKRAVVASTQLMAGKRPEDVTLDEFPEDEHFTNSIVGVGDKFKMTIKGVDQSACDLIKNLSGGVIRQVNCKDEEEFTVELLFNNDLSTEERASDYNGSQEACEADESRLYCPDGSCILATETCPEEEITCEVLECGENGMWNQETCKCVCDEGWFGKLCNFDCVLDLDGLCHSCSERELFQATQEECSKCDDEKTPRKIFVRAKKNFCGLISCGSGYFQGTNGTCYPCSDPNAYTVADENACSECGNEREMYGNYCALKTCDAGDFHNDTGKCIPCSSVPDDSTIKGTCSECADTDNPLFELNNGRCEPCASRWGVFLMDLSTTAENCNVCANTNYPRFYGLDGQCYSCTNYESSPATSVECSKCNPARTIFNWDDRVYATTQCGLVTCPSDTFQALNGSCYSCAVSAGAWTTEEECSSCAQFGMFRFFRSNYQDGTCFSCYSLPNGITWSNVSKEECVQCDRKYCESSGSCILKTATCSCPTIFSCSAHGTWDDTKCSCICNEGWYGESCNLDCNEMDPNVSVTECAKCSNRKYCDNTGTCVLTTDTCPQEETTCEALECGDHGDWSQEKCKCECNEGWFGKVCDSNCDGVKVSNGRCIPCSAENGIRLYGNYIPESECHRCENTLWGVVEESEGPSCSTCSDNSYIKASSSECARCDGSGYPRKMVGEYCNPDWE